MLLYLREFEFPSIDDEEGFLNEIEQTWHNTYYPFRVLIDKELGTIEFKPITIFYGGNGNS